MNTPSPLIPQGAMVHPQGKSHFRIAVFTILTVHIVLLGALLLQGCKRSEDPASGGGAQPGSSESTNLIGRWEPPPPPLPDDSTLTARTQPQPSSTPANTAIPPIDDTNPPPVLVSTNDVIPVPPPVDPVTPNTGIETPPPVTPNELAVREHTIKSGDNFYELAQQYGVTVAAIEKQNPNKDPRRLQVGDVITIPPPEPATPTTTGSTNAAGQTLYEVKSGDNLTRIAARYDTTISELRSVNNLSSDRIFVGQKLIIP